MDSVLLSEAPPDIRAVPLNEPVDETALDAALKRILSSSSECNFNSFSSAISNTNFNSAI